MGVVEIIIADAKVVAQREGMAVRIEKGMEKGKEITESKKNYDFTQSLIQNCPDWSDEKIAMIVGVSTDFVLKVRVEMNNQGS